MDNKDLREIQSTGIEACEITLKNGQKKRFDDRYLLYLLESDTDNNKSDSDYSDIACKEVSDNELLNLIIGLLGLLENKGYPKHMLAWLLFRDLE